MKTNMKTRLTAMILAAAIPFTVVTTFAAEEPYEKNEVSVGEAVEALYALDGEPDMIKEIHDTGDWLYADYEKNPESWARAYDILPEGSSMDADMTRSELTELLYNYAKHHDVDVTVNGQRSADEWGVSYDLVPAGSGEEETVTPAELAAILAKYEAADLPKVGVVADGLSLIYPSENQMTISPLCDFYVIGDIDASVTVPNNAQLFVQLRDSNGALLRDVFTTIKDNQRGMYVDYPGLTVQSGTRESFRNSMMPDLVYDPNFPESFGNTWMKACYTDEHYTSVIYGGGYRDDINPVDQYGRTLGPLPEGDYDLTVLLISGGTTLASLSAQITIGAVPKKVISRFSPAFYLKLVKEYAAQQGYVVFTDPYPGVWIMADSLPHWGNNDAGEITKRWRYTDRMGYVGGMTYLFNYNITATSTSYTVELGQLGYDKELEDPNRLTYVYWDIGEPEIKQQGKVYTGKFVEKSASAMDDILVTRIDHSTVDTPENTINPTILSETTSEFDPSQRFNAAVGETVSVNGLCKVIQPDQVTLNENETFTMGNRIAAVRYTLAYASGEVIQVVEKNVGLTRTMENGYTATSVLEFRHNFAVTESMRGNDVRIFAQAIDAFGEEVGGQLYVCTFRVPRR